MRTALREARLGRALTVDEMAATLGTTPSCYYKIEQGVRNPSIGLAKRIADLLGVRMDALFFGQGMDETSKRSTAIPSPTDRKEATSR